MCAPTKDLTSEAITAFYQEFQKRNLDTAIFDSLRVKQWAEQQRRFEGMKAAEAQEKHENKW